MSIFEYDNNLNIKYLCGVDEAGRGPLAGDVYAAAVILPQNCFIEGLNDSKKLTIKKREELFLKIIDIALDYSVGVASVKEIEEYNILQATFIAMNRAVDGLEIKPNIILVDGNQNPKLSFHSRLLVKGDQKSACIAAASIIAKVSRDRYMDEIDNMYPCYQFNKHKGYGTKLHYSMIDEHGISPIHRISFLKKYLSDDRYTSRKKGEETENLAIHFLKFKGYNFIEKNYYSKHGEIDIIVTLDNTIIFVEVKSRKENSLVSPVESVTPAKQKRILQTAIDYLTSNDIKKQPRFDIIEVFMRNNPSEKIKINHIKNAFDGSEFDGYI